MNKVAATARETHDRVPYVCIGDLRGIVAKPAQKHDLVMAMDTNHSLLELPIRTWKGLNRNILECFSEQNRLDFVVCFLRVTQSESQSAFDYTCGCVNYCPEGHILEGGTHGSQYLGLH